MPIPTTTPSSNPAVGSPKLQLNLQHRNIPESRLLADLSRVAAILQTNTLTQSDYRRHSLFNPLTLTARFGNWNTALKKAGLRPSRNFRVSPQCVIADIQQIAKTLNTRRLLGSAYVKQGAYSLPVIYRLFGCWANAIKAAGLLKSHYRPLCSDTELLENLRTLWYYYNRQPTCLELKPPRSRFGLGPYQRRFGGFENALKALVQWQETNQLPQPLSADHHRINHKTTRSINWRLRYQILKRDSFRCQACGRSPATHPDVRLQVDHIHPWSRGGETTAENLQTLCDRCNIGKCDM